MSCRMVQQGYPPGKCAILMPDETRKPACVATLKWEDGQWHRVITSAHLSRPEDYFSIYQSGCNHRCLKCHSWYFSQVFNGHWVSTDSLAEMCAEYEEGVTVWEPRERATMFHATDLCHHCGSCVVEGRPGHLCPGKLSSEQILLGPQGWGPVRNIVSFTGGDVGCCAEFYAEATRKIKEACNKTWVLFETNGYGLTPQNLDLLANAGLDLYWLDIKAYNEETYKRLCGTTNQWILQLPEEIVDKGFVLEVLSLFIPGWVETDQIVKIAQLLFEVDPEIPFTILAFFPEHQLKENRAPTFWEMIQTYFSVKNVGLKNIKLGNCHVFSRTSNEWELLVSAVGTEAIG